MLGKILSHYTILDKLGAGGMGVVYRARDERLNRVVALKVLAPAILSDESARRRFRSEAMALSRLSHPNIATIHDFDSQDGVDFLIMEFVEGETLGQRLIRGPLTQSECLAFGVQVAEALEEAHERDVIHRDLKPGNLMIGPKGRVKVLDFGLAKLARLGETGETAIMSATGSWSGTLPYTPPEQLEGQAIDARSDLYALGAILYEAVTGRRAFAAPNAARLFSAILNDRPAYPSTIVTGVSPAFDSMVLRLLDKVPARRPASARDLLADLRSIQDCSRLTGAPPTMQAPNRIQGIVVLPLENLSGDPEQEFFADGMTEELISDIAQIQALRVISRTSAMRYKRTQKTLQDIGRELNVDAVVEGSVRRHGDRVRITAQLIEVATDRHLWAKSYERDLRDVLALQGEVAQAIAHEIRVKLTPREEARFARAHSVDPRAYEAYLRGRHHWNKRNDEGLLRSLEYFREAIERDPAWATAHVGLADAYNVIGFYGTLPPGDSFPKAKAAATAALRIDENLAEAYADLGYVQNYYEWNWEESDRSFRRALELNDGSAYIHLFYMNNHIATGRHEKAIRAVERAFELDPFSMIINTARGWARFYARDLDGAAHYIRRLVEMEPEFSTAHAWLACVYEARGELDQSLAAATRAAELTGRGPWALVGLARAYARMGRKAEAEAVLAEMRELAGRRYVSPLDIALVLEALGETDQALGELERAYHEKANLFALMRVEPRLDSLRGEPRFQSLERAMRYPNPAE